MTTHIADSALADLAHLGLLMTGRVGTVTINERLATPMATLHGGAALGLAVGAMESVTGLGAVWATAQFVGVARLDDELDLGVEVLASGRSSSQLRVVGTSGSRLIFHAMGATGAGRDGIPARTVPVMPDVGNPDDHVESELPVDERLQGRGHFPTLEYRRTHHHDGLCVWIRVRGYTACSPALLSLIADYLPLSIMIEAGMPDGGGTSLDNTIRFGPRRYSEWVLVDCRTTMIERGYGHGVVHLWSPDGDLLAVASQTSTQRHAQ